MKRTAFASLLLSLAACPDRTISKVEPQQARCARQAYPGERRHRHPVRDRQLGVDARQADRSSQQNFPKFVAALDAFPTGRPNLHVGVVDTTVDIERRRLRPGCPSPDPGRQRPAPEHGARRGLHAAERPLHQRHQGRERQRASTNYTGTLDQALSCIAQVGASGCGFEAPARGDEARARRLADREPGLHPRRRVPRGDLPDRRGRRVGQGSRGVRAARRHGRRHERLSRAAAVRLQVRSDALVERRRHVHELRRRAPTRTCKIAELLQQLPQRREGSGADRRRGDRGPAARRDDERLAAADRDVDERRRRAAAR